MLAVLLGLVLSQAPMPFTAVARGVVSNIDEPRTVVVRTAAEWGALWKAHGAQEPAPPVDFMRDIVVGVFLGSRPTAGFSVEITRARTEEHLTVVEYVVRVPPPAGVTAQVLTAPFHLVTLPARSAPVEFRRVTP